MKYTTRPDGSIIPHESTFSFGWQEWDGCRIRQHRKAKRLSQAKLGIALGVSQATIASWESGTAPAGVPGKHREALCQVLGVEEAVLFSLRGYWRNRGDKPKVRDF